jgi:hypothetical protein
MKKTMILAVVFALVAAAAIASQGPEEMILGLNGKKPVIFPHAEHQGRMECVTCHHDNDTGERKCGVCHNDSLEIEGLNSYKKIGHNLCKGCHKKQENRKQMTRCKTCHNTG